MAARIYQPAKTAMQSGFGNTKGWVLDFEPEAPRRVEPFPVIAEPRRLNLGP